jgi:hypothetical protein
MNALRKMNHDPTDTWFLPPDWGEDNPEMFIRAGGEYYFLTRDFRILKVNLQTFEPSNENPTNTWNPN